MAAGTAVTVNGARYKVTPSIDTPLLYILHNELHLHSPRFGCLDTFAKMDGSCYFAEHRLLLDWSETRPSSPGS